jgi:hypothetical protein
MAVTSDRSARNLQLAGALFAAGSLVHLLDHLRRGQGSVTDALYWAGNLALIVQVAVITLVLTRHRVAPIAAAAGGFPLAIGFLAAHWVPEWSALSDPVWEIESLPVLSYVASALEIVGALAVGVCGLAILRREGLESASPRATPAASLRG